MKNSGSRWRARTVASPSGTASTWTPTPWPVSSLEHPAGLVYPPFLAPAPFASGSLFQLAPVDLLGLRRPYPNVFAARNLSEQSSGLAQRGLHVEVVEAGDAVSGNYDVEPPHGGTGRRVMDADVGDRATDDERIHAPKTQHVLQPRAVEGIVAWLAYGCLVFVRGKPVNHLPAPATLAAMLAPDLPLRVAIVVGILDEDNPHVGLPRQLQQIPYRRYGSLGARNDERARLRNEIVLHVPYDQGRPARVYPNAVLYLILRDLHGACHSNLLRLQSHTQCTAKATGVRLSACQHFSFAHAGALADLLAPPQHGQHLPDHEGGEDHERAEDLECHEAVSCEPVAEEPGEDGFHGHDDRGPGRRDVLLHRSLHQESAGRRQKPGHEQRDPHPGRRQGHGTCERPHNDEEQRHREDLGERQRASVVGGGVTGEERDVQAEGRRTK